MRKYLLFFIVLFFAHLDFLFSMELNSFGSEVFKTPKQTKQKVGENKPGEKRSFLVSKNLKKALVSVIKEEGSEESLFPLKQVLRFLFSKVPYHSQLKINDQMSFTLFMYSILYTAGIDVVLVKDVATGSFNMLAVWHEGNLIILDLRFHKNRPAFSYENKYDIQKEKRETQMGNKAIANLKEEYKELLYWDSEKKAFTWGGEENKEDGTKFLHNVIILLVEFYEYTELYLLSMIFDNSSLDPNLKIQKEKEMQCYVPENIENVSRNKNKQQVNAVADFLKKPLPVGKDGFAWEKELKGKLQSILEGIPFLLQKEKALHLFLYTFFLVNDFDVIAEDTSAAGRADIVLKFDPGRVVIIELKANLRKRRRSCENELKSIFQREARRYIDNFFKFIPHFVGERFEEYEKFLIGKYEEVIKEKALLKKYGKYGFLKSKMMDFIKFYMKEFETMSISNEFEEKFNEIFVCNEKDESISNCDELRESLLECLSSICNIYKDAKSKIKEEKIETLDAAFIQIALKKYYEKYYFDSVMESLFSDAKEKIARAIAESFGFVINLGNNNDISIILPYGEKKEKSWVFQTPLPKVNKSNNKSKNNNKKRKVDESTNSKNKKRIKKLKKS